MQQFLDLLRSRVPRHRNADFKRPRLPIYRRIGNGLSQPDMLDVIHVHENPPAASVSFAHLPERPSGRCGVSALYAMPMRDSVTPLTTDATIPMTERVGCRSWSRAAEMSPLRGDNPAIRIAAGRDSCYTRPERASPRAVLERM